MKAIQMTEGLYQYNLKHSFTPLPILKRIEDETKSRPDAIMQISPDQGSFMAMMVQLIAAKTAIEIGCYTGYSAISIASGLAPDGILYSLDIDDKAIATSKKYTVEAGLNDKIRFIHGPAMNSLEAIKNQLPANSVDFAFIDADKENQISYYEALLDLLRPNGLIIADNVLWSGRVIDDHALASEKDTKAIVAFNQHVKSDKRVDATMLHISDGLYLIRKK